MAQVLCRATDDLPHYEKGDIVFVGEDGHPWSPTSEGLPNFVVFDVSGVPRETMDFRRNAWHRLVNLTVLNQNANGWRVEAVNSLGSAVNKPLLRSEIEEFITLWGATVFSEAANRIVFDAGVEAAIESNGFWDRDVASVIFTHPGRSGNIFSVQADYTALGFTQFQAQAAIARRGGVVTSHVGSVVNFDIDRNDVRDKFRDDIQSKCFAQVGKRQYAMPVADVDAAVLAGGTLAMTQVEFDSKVIDRVTL